MSKLTKHKDNAHWITRHSFFCLAIWFFGLGMAKYANDNKATAIIYLITVPACLSMEYMMCRIFKKLDSNKDNKHFKG